MKSQRKGRLRKVARTIALALVGYLLLGALVHFWLLPQSPLPADSLPRPGDRLVSRAEGLEQEILRVVDGQVYTRVVLLPGAEGPPVHWHRGFDEHFQVTEGILHLEVEGEIRQLGPGETLRIRAGTGHRPFNPTGQQVLVENPDQPTFPVEFAACLAQLYRFMDRRGSREPGPRMAAQMAVFQSVCDTHVMPRGVEPLLVALVAPTARLLGMKNYYARVSSSS